VAQGRAPHGEGRSWPSVAAAGRARSRTGHWGCSRGQTGGARGGSHGQTPPWRRARWDCESADTASSRMRLQVGSPSRPGGLAAVQHPPSATTRADAGKRARRDTVRHDTHTAAPASKPAARPWFRT
jgi:hypothetical protein